MVVVGKPFTSLLIVVWWLKSNHLIAENDFLHVNQVSTQVFFCTSFVGRQHWRSTNSLDKLRLELIQVFLAVPSRFVGGLGFSGFSGGFKFKCYNPQVTLFAGDQFGQPSFASPTGHRSGFMS